MPIIEKNLKPAFLFWGFAFIHFFLWTLVPALVSPNQPLDVIEGYAWGREWLIGTAKHPPMQAWCLEIMSFLTGRAAWGSFLASQIAVVTAFWAVWQLGRLITNERNALLGVLLLEGVAYFNLTSPEFNPNILLPAFWSLSALFFYRALRDNRLLDWALTGLWIAGGLYAKYATGLLLFVFVFILVFHADARKNLRGIGPYVALLIATVLFLPHLVWLWDHAFLPFAYAESRTIHAKQALDYFLYPLHFIGSQFLAALGALFLFFGSFGNRLDENRTTSSFDRFFLTALCFGPIIILVLSSLIGGLKMRDMWGAGLWSWLGLWLVAIFPPAPSKKFAPPFVGGFWALFFLFLLVLVLSDSVFPPLGRKAKRIHFPGMAIARGIETEWEKTSGDPLRYVVGDVWLAGNVAFYAGNDGRTDRPHVFIDANNAVSPWIDENDLKRSGGVLVWCGMGCHDEDAAKNIPAYMMQRFPNAKLQKELIIASRKTSDFLPFVVGWAIIPKDLLRNK